MLEYKLKLYGIQLIKQEESYTSKASFPEQAFDGESLPCFENVFILLHPDYENQKKNRQKQLQAKNSFSKSKEKRQRRKECVLCQTVA